MTTAVVVGAGIRALCGYHAAESAFRRLRGQTGSPSA